MIKTKCPEEEFNPIKNLWVAVLEQAIEDIRQKEINRLKKRLGTAKRILKQVKIEKNVGRIKQKKRVIDWTKELINQAETVNNRAKHWLFTDNFEIVDPAVGSFLWICDLLGLDPEAIRKELKRRVG